MPRALSLVKMDEVYVLAMAGASERQVVELTGISKGTAHNYIMFFRDRIKCDHGQLRYLCRKCNYRRVVSISELQKLMKTEVIRETYWNIWIQLNDGKQHIYRIIKQKERPNGVLRDLRASDPRCDIAAVWAAVMVPSRLELAWQTFAQPGKRGTYGARAR